MKKDMLKQEWTGESLAEALPDVAKLIESLLADPQPRAVLDTLQAFHETHTGTDEEQCLDLFLLSGTLSGITNITGLVTLAAEGQPLSILYLLKRTLVTDPVVDQTERDQLEALGALLFEHLKPEGWEPQR